MASATRGNAAEAAVLSALTARNFDVFLPFGSGHPFDLVVHLADASFVRIQCKHGRERRGCLLFNCRSTDHGRGPGSYLGLADLFGVFLPSTGAVYLIPIDAVASFEGRLRLMPAQNNQRKKTRPAAPFEIDRWTRERLLGLVAVP